MKRTDKKGFTIVELVIVIAVIAILAAVLIPNLSKMVRNAKESSDIQLIRNMNTAMQVESVGGTKRYDTAHDAITAATAAGYDLTKISLSDKENTILWDEENQCFAYLRKGETTPEYVPNSKKDNTNTPAEKLWKVETEVKENGVYPYSVYWNGGNVAAIKVKNVGFDAGIANIGTVNYTGDAGKTVVIRTNSYSTTLIINAANDSVKHYDLLGVLTIENVKGESYHEFGKVKNVTIKNGRFVAEEGSEIETIVSETGATVDTSKCTIWNAPTYTWSSDKTTCTATRIDKKGVKTETETVTATVETVPATIEAAGKTTYTATFVNPAFAEQTEEVEIPKQLSVEETLVDSMNAAIEGYTGESIMKALVFMSDKGTNVTVANFVHSDKTKTFAYDITAHRFYIVNTADGAVQYPANTTASGELVYVVNSCNTITRNMTRIYTNNIESISQDQFKKVISCLKSIEVGGNVEEITSQSDFIIKYGCFYGFSKLESIYVGRQVKKIACGSFANTSNVNYVYYNANATTIEKTGTGKYPFSGAGSNSAITLEIGKEVISVPALFADDSNDTFNVTKVVFEEGTCCRTIEGLAFRYFDIEEITLPKTLTRIEGFSSSTGAFAHCTKLKKINWFGNAITMVTESYYQDGQWVDETITFVAGGTSNNGINEFQNYMRSTGTFSTAPNLVIELIK